MDNTIANIAQQSIVGSRESLQVAIEGTVFEVGPPVAHLRQQQRLPLAFTQSLLGELQVGADGLVNLCQCTEGPVDLRRFGLDRRNGCFVPRQFGQS